MTAPLYRSFDESMSIIEALHASRLGGCRSAGKRPSQSKSTCASLEAKLSKSSALAEVKIFMFHRGEAQILLPSATAW
jgi:hypothetical protein